MGYTYWVTNGLGEEADERTARIMQSKMREAVAQLKVFGDNFAKNPLHAFEWQKKAVRGAAMRHILLGIAAELDNGRFMDADLVLVDTLNLLRYIDGEIRRNVGGAPGMSDVWQEYVEMLVELRQSLEH